MERNKTPQERHAEERAAVAGMTADEHTERALSLMASARIADLDKSGNFYSGAVAHLLMADRLDRTGKANA